MRGSAPMAKLVLLRLNDHAAGEPAEAWRWKTSPSSTCCPASRARTAVWRTLFPDAAERDQCTESLGNLVLMTKAQNDRAGNLDFARKKEVLFKAGTTQPLPINDYVRRQTDWKATHILDREAEVLHRLDQLWAIGPPPGRGDAAARARRQGRTSPEADARR